MTDGIIVITPNLILIVECVSSQARGLYRREFMKVILRNIITLYDVVNNVSLCIIIHSYIHTVYKLCICYIHTLGNSMKFRHVCWL